MSRIEVERVQLERWYVELRDGVDIYTAAELEMRALLTPSPERDEWYELAVDYAGGDAPLLESRMRALHAKLVAKVEEERDLAKRVSKANADEVLRLKSLPLIPRSDARRLAEVAVGAYLGGNPRFTLAIDRAAAAIETELNKAGEKEGIRGDAVLGQPETVRDTTGNPPSPASSVAELIEAVEEFQTAQREFDAMHPELVLPVHVINAAAQRRDDAEESALEFDLAPLRAAVEADRRVVEAARKWVASHINAPRDHLMACDRLLIDAVCAHPDYQKGGSDAD